MNFYLFIERNACGGKWMASGWSDDETVVIRHTEWQANSCHAFGIQAQFGWIELGALTTADRLELLTKVPRLD